LCIFGEPGNRASRLLVCSLSDDPHYYWGFVSTPRLRRPVRRSLENARTWRDIARRAAEFARLRRLNDQRAESSSRKRNAHARPRRRSSSDLGDSRSAVALALALGGLGLRAALAEAHGAGLGVAPARKKVTGGGDAAGVAEDQKRYAGEYSHNDDCDRYEEARFEWGRRGGVGRRGGGLSLRGFLFFGLFREFGEALTARSTTRSPGRARTGCSRRAGALAGLCFGERFLYGLVERGLVHGRRGGARGGAPGDSGRKRLRSQTCERQQDDQAGFGEDSRHVLAEFHEQRE
jgi:hypothetical protein